MTRAQKTILSVLGLVACILLGMVLWILYINTQAYWTTPLGPALNLPTESISSPTLLPATNTASSPDLGFASPSPTFTLVPASDSYTYLPTVTQPPTVTPFPTFTPSALTCGSTEVMTLLAIGTDSRSGKYEYGLADVIRVVRVDFMNRKISILEFPRDLWVEIPEISDNLKGQDHEKLNQAYLYGNPGFGYWDDPSAGPGLLARTLNLNFGVRPDHYVAVSMRVFEKIVDAVDGIDIYLPEAVDGRTKEDPRKSLYFAKGTHHLSGSEALQLARIRLDGVFERANTQNRILCALRDKLVTPSVLPKIPEIIQSFMDNIQTDMSPEQISTLACFGTRIDPSLILFASFPQELFKPDWVYDPVFKAKLFAWDVDFTVMREYVTMFHEGSWPVPDTSEDDEESLPFCPPPGQ